MTEEKKPRKKAQKKLPQLMYELTHARHEPGHCLSGLFRSIKKGERKKGKLDVTYKTGDKKLRFVGFEFLGVDDLRVLQGLISMGGPSKLRLKLDGSAKTEIGRILAVALNPREYAKNMVARYIETTIYKLMKEIGYKTDSKPQYKLVDNSLTRMANVTMFVEIDGIKWSSNLLSFSLNEHTKELSVALNPLVTRAILGEIKFTWIDMREVRSLKTDSARLIHERLCAWVNQGEKSKPVSLDKITSYVWPDPATDGTMRKRRFDARKALKEIEGTGWKMEEIRKGIFLFTRPTVLYVNKDLPEREPKKEV
jgi:hypothetical protein